MSWIKTLTSSYIKVYNILVDESLVKMSGLKGKKCCCAALATFFFTGAALAVEFNTDVLDSGQNDNIDFSRFSESGYIMPGEYQMFVAVNGQNIAPSQFPVEFKEHKAKNEENQEIKRKAVPQACVTSEIVDKMGLTLKTREALEWYDNNNCADFVNLEGITIKPDLASSVLIIDMPQSLLEYSDATWSPPSRWDDGISGVMLDYNMNGNINKPHEGDQSQTLSYNGTTGANLGPWRLRADYQGNLNNTTGDKYGATSDYDWTRFYMFRAIPRLQSKLTLGENYISSDIFSTWKYTGASLETDERMLPPKLRGYAPQVSGVAETNARVVISQQGRILYDSTVPSGPFTIQELDSSVRGKLDVEIIEQNGKISKFQVETGHVPFLTRPGQVRYKLVSGQSLNNDSHITEGPIFISGEGSWGINNYWSIYGGTIIAGDYNALSAGVGRNMEQFGTISADLTRAVAKFSDNKYGDMEGQSVRLSYNKRIEEIDADMNFAGYRFSQSNYMTMQQYLDARYRNEYLGREKQLYTATFNKNFEELNASASIQYSYQTYWDQSSENYYTFSLNRYFDAFNIKNISIGLTASRSDYDGRSNDSYYMRVSIPWGTGMFSYNGSSNGDGRITQTVGYSDTLNNGLDSYNINAGMNTGGGEGDAGQFSGYYNHHSPYADVSGNFSTVSNSYSSLGLNVSGGATITAKGAALHTGGMNGGTRLLVDTDGIADVPVDGGRVRTNLWGSGVVTDMSSYYRHTTMVNVKDLPEDMEATRAVVDSVLTEGAIGYRNFEILKGKKLFVVIRKTDSSTPPFGSVVMNTKGRELGMVSDEGLAWLSGINPSETLTVNWDGKSQCEISIPDKVDPEKQLFLQCRG